MSDANTPPGGAPPSPDNNGDDIAPNGNPLGTFRPAILHSDGEYDVYGRLTKVNLDPEKSLDTMSKLVDGIRRKAEPRVDVQLIESKNKRREKLYLVDSLLAQLEKAPWEVKSLEEKLSEAAALREELEGSTDSDNFARLDANIDSLKEWVEEAQSELKKAELEESKTELKESIEKSLLKGEKRKRFDKLEHRADKLLDSPNYQKTQDLLNALAWLQNDTKCNEFTGDPSEVEAKLSEVETLIVAEEGELARKQRQLDISAAIATTNFGNKKLQAVDLLTKGVTAAEKDSTEALIDEIKVLEAGFSPDTVTQDQIDTFNQKLSELDTKIASRRGLIDTNSREKTERIRQAEQLIAIFEQRRRRAEELLLNPATSGKNTATRTLLAEVEVASAALKNSNDITSAEVDIFIAKIAEVEDKIDELQTIADAEKSRQEGMYSWHGEWPREIKYVEAKKPTKPGAVGEKGGWKKDGKLLPNQPIWGKLNSQSLRVFKKYNDIIDKALGLGREEEVKDLVAIKEAAITALYAEKPEDALREVTKLEKESEKRGPGIENAAELKELTAKFDIVVTSLARLAPTISTLEKSLLDARKTELEETLTELKKDEVRSDAVKSKELLRQSKEMLDGFSSAVNEKEKESRQVAGVRLAEFKSLAGRLETMKLTISSRLADVLSPDEKTEMGRKVAAIETRASEFGEHETKKDYVKAREALILFKSNLDELGEEVDKKLALVKEAKTTKNEKDDKSLEEKKAFKKEFTDAKKFFEKLQGEVESFVVNGLLGAEEKQAFDRRARELTGLITAFEAETDPKKAKNTLGLFKAILGEFSTFVIQKIGNPKRIKDEIDRVTRLLAVETTDSGRKRLEEKIEDLNITLERINALEKAYKAINKDSSRRPQVMRPVSDGQTIVLSGTRDPLTGKPKEITRGEWIAKQQEDAALKQAALEERKRKTEEELKEMHKKMWERDKEGYKRLYAGRTWGPENEVTQKIADGLLQEKVTEANQALLAIMPEVNRRKVLAAEAKTRDLTELEVEELAALDEKVLPFVNEIKSLTKRPKEEEERALRAEATRDSALSNWTLNYNPSLDKSLDWIGFANRALTREERKRFIKASILRRSEALRKANDGIPGFTKVAPSGQATTVTRADLGDTNEKLAAAAFGAEVKIGTKEAERNAGGMDRSVMKEDGPKVTDDKVLKAVNKGAFEMPDQVMSRQPLTQEEVERRMSRVNSVLGTVTRFAKSNWRVLASIGLAGAGFGAAGLASAATLEPAHVAKTLEQVSSWRDFLNGLSESEAARLIPFIKHLTGK